MTSARLTLVSHIFACLTIISIPATATAQETGPLKSGEAFVTRFPGISGTGASAVINLDGTIGGIVDLRAPAQPPQGQHWLNEPQRNPVKARDTGLVFGIALDDAKSPGVYLTATAAFGLHRTANNNDWMPGMWGPNAGPGTVWKIDSATGRATVFARIGVNGRRNTGAALGNIAYDKWNKQLYVSDLESGLIHRLKLSDGSDLGQFDHGMQGRAAFLDVATGQQRNLPTVAFDPGTAARIDCPAPFAKTPACWNLADFRRRVWGVGVRKDEKSNEVRLYYAVWSSEGFENDAFAGAAEEEKHNSLWSVAIGANGDFDTASVRKEFQLPDFFTNPDDIARFGFSRPVADIAFCKCKDQKIMLVSERGGMRNLGLDDENPFAYPHQSRVLRYELDDAGVWQAKGRYDVGFYDRKDDGQPFVRANGAGGVDFGYAYNEEWRADKDRPDQTAWMTGGELCSPQAPCFSPDLSRNEDGSYVAGGQGTPRDGFSELLPEDATKPYPGNGAPYPATGPRQSYLFDTDINIDASNNAILDELTRNDATKIGDIEVFEDCEAVEEPPLVEDPPLVEEPPIVDETPPGEEPPDLEKIKTGPAQCIEGGICTFTITITNRGAGVWSGPLWEIDTLPPGATLQNYRPQPEWVCTQAGGTSVVNCMHDWITLNPGDSVTLVIDVRLPFGRTGPAENCVADFWLPNWDPNDPAVILAIEQALNALGYPVGAIDGVLDVQTINAISIFQQDAGLPVNGIPDQALIDLLFGGSAGLPGDANPANDQDCHTVNVTPLPQPAPTAGPDLTVQKIQRTTRCRPGGLCDFEVRFTNRGPTPWTGVPMIVDTLPVGAQFVAATAPAICTQSGRTLTCRYPRQITVPPNTTGRLVITIRMPQNARSGVQNCIRIPPSVNPNDPNRGNDRMCIPVRVTPRPDPDIQTLKFQTTDDCVPGGECTFDLWFINRGPGNWRGRPVLRDQLPPGATLVRQSAGWTCRQSGSVVTCTLNTVTLRPWRGVKVSLTVRLPDNIATNARNCVRIAGSAANGRDPVRHNNSQCIPIHTGVPPVPAAPTPPDQHGQPTPQPVQPTQGGTEKTQLGPCKPGSSCLFEIKFINRGSSAWTGKARIVDVLPSADITLGTWSPTRWRCTQSGRLVTCEHSGATIAPNQHLSVLLTLKMPSDFHAGSQNCAVVDRAGVDPLQNTDRHCVPIDTATPGAQPRPPGVVTPPPEVAAECPKGSVKRGDRCYSCPRGYVLRGTKCYSTRRTCPRGYVLRGNRCYPIIRQTCPPGYLRVGNACIRINIPRSPPRFTPPRGGHHHE